MAGLQLIAGHTQVRIDALDRHSAMHPHRHHVEFRVDVGLGQHVNQLVGRRRRHMNAGPEVRHQQELADGIGAAVQRHHEARNAHRPTLHAVHHRGRVPLRPQPRHQLGHARIGVVNHRQLVVGEQGLGMPVGRHQRIPTDLLKAVDHRRHAGRRCLVRRLHPSASHPKHHQQRDQPPCCNPSPYPCLPCHQHTLSCQSRTLMPSATA